MALYKYKAKDKKDKVFEDVIQATNKKEAVSLLKVDELQVLTIKNLEKKDIVIFGGGISVSEKAAFCRFMSTMLKAGLPLPEALDIIRQETQNKKFQSILFDLIFHIRKGEALSSVLAKYKEEFDVVFLTMIKAGEESGTVEQSFDYLAKQLLASHELSQKVKSAMMYPSIIIAAMLASGGIMVGFVLPKMSEVFLSLNVELPTVTRFVLNFGQKLGANLLLTFGVFFSCIFFTILLFMIRSTRKFIFSYLVRLPVISTIMDQLDTARFSRTLSTLLRSGVPIMVALDVTSDVLRQPNLKKHAKEFSEGVSKGMSLSEVLTKKKKSFPVTLIQTIKAGEKTGSLEVVLEELATFYESEVDYSLKRATSLLEPLLMLIIGLAVGVMVVLLITPIYSIVGGLESGCNMPVNTRSNAQVGKDYSLITLIVFIFFLLSVIISISAFLKSNKRNGGLKTEDSKVWESLTGVDEENSISDLFQKEFSEKTEKDEKYINDPFREICKSSEVEGVPSISSHTVCYY